MTLRSLTYAGFLHIRTHLRTCWSLLIDPLLMTSLHLHRPDVECTSIRQTMLRWRGVVRLNTGPVGYVRWPTYLRIEGASVKLYYAAQLFSIFARGCWPMPTAGLDTGDASVVRSMRLPERVIGPRNSALST